MSHALADTIFWVEVEKIKPNPFQPRKEFDDAALSALADSIRQYGVLQPLVVTRKEIEREDGGLAVEYELIAGERRLRASKLAGVAQVPVVIRTGEQTDQMKLELAIIENLQREDLNPIDRAVAFDKLISNFKYTHVEIAKKIGKSREYVSNTVRMLQLPEEMKQAVRDGKISEGHTRPLLMLIDRPEEQATVFKDIMLRKLSVRDTEKISRKIAIEKIRKQTLDPVLLNLEQELSEKLGTRVQIDKKQDSEAGRITIDYFSVDELRMVLSRFDGNLNLPQTTQNLKTEVSDTPEEEKLKQNDVTKKEIESDDSDLYSITNFSL